MQELQRLQAELQGQVWATVQVYVRVCMCGCEGTHLEDAVQKLQRLQAELQGQVCVCAGVSCWLQPLEP